MLHGLHLIKPHKSNVIIEQVISCIWFSVSMSIYIIFKKGKVFIILRMYLLINSVSLFLYNPGYLDKNALRKEKEQPAVNMRVHNMLFPFMLIFHYSHVALLRLDKHSRLNGTDTHTELKAVLHPFIWLKGCCHSTTMLPYFLLSDTDLKPQSVGKAASC